MKTPTTITRAFVQRSILDFFSDTSYLEVGISKGVTFHAVQADKKVAVDPKFKFDIEQAAQENRNSSYHVATSDEYFLRIIDENERFDLIYLDGLHTFEQTFKDFTNALAHLKPDGVIVIDDSYPPTYLSSLKDIQTFRQMREITRMKPGGWAGDVYRLVLLIAAYYPHITYRTIEDNHGQLVLWRQRREPVDVGTVEAVSRAPFEQVQMDRSPFNFMPFDDILKELKAWLERKKAA